MRKQPVVAGRELALWMKAEGLSEQDLVRRLSVQEQPLAISQSWLSRIMGGRFRRFAGKTAGVLAHAGIRIDDGEIRMGEARALIDAAVGEVWDGTYAGAETVASLLRGAAALGRSSRGRRPDGRGSA